MRELKKNGSPLPEFETDADRTYMITTIKIHEGFKFEKVLPIIKYLDKNGKITPQVAEMVIKKSKSTTYRYLTMLVETGYVEVSGNTNNAVYKIVL